MSVIEVATEKVIDTIWVKPQHALVEFFSRLRFRVQPIEVSNVRARRGDVARTIVTVRYLMSGDDGRWLQAFDRVKGRDPFASSSRVGFGEVGMDPVVDGISSDDETDRGHMETG